MSYQSSQRFSTAIVSLAPFSGTWDRQKAAHLLRRTVLGPRIDEINRAQRDGLSRTLDLLLSQAPIPSPPVKYRTDDDEYLQMGETWVDKSCLGKNQYRSHSLKGWYYNNMVQADRPSNIQERMSFFWLNYFSISAPNSDPRAMYKDIRLYQEFAVGNFRTLLQKITVDPRMLRCLNGDVNSKENPNENYARELMELFTLGKGPQVGPGDYTTYTEDDVAALARALTGWKIKPYRFAKDNTPVESYFDSSDHDTGDKKLSPRLGSQVIKNAGAEEYKVIIDILLKQDAAALHFCRELYRYFVFHDINPTIEAQVIEPLARTLRDNNYEIKPVLKQLLSSEHFYEAAHTGAIIKNPHDFLCSIVRPFREFWHDKPMQDLRMRYELGGKYADYMYDLGMEFLDPPTISGWKAYYDSPQFYRHWISPALMQRRVQISTAIIDGDFHINGTRLSIDYYSFLKDFTNPTDINSLIDEIVLVFLPRPISTQQIAALRETIMGGLEDKEWTMSCRDFLANPGNDNYAKPIQSRMARFFVDLFALGEFQLQ
ncbi:uncharacterized protein (DUF1800 family) [Lewinella marina]|uniref:DUF1800 domain-containing protein n=1 Tax=Neolewinella marina TaxID=438751 RepID=UPI00142F5069|nr:DUF1800 domain-containing protein [Neolewinella marina]NJB87424.1 uncharacterized protein (DUF1800 family) [Neolewinella marina]